MIDVLLSLLAGLLVPGGGVMAGVALGSLLDRLHPLRRCTVTPSEDNGPTEVDHEHDSVQAP